MTRWWLADTHFNHANIVAFCSRPPLKPEYLTPSGKWVSQEAALLCAEENNRFLTRNINQRVKPEDRGVCVGDFSCKGGDRGVAGLKTPPAEILKQLNGDWVIVEGNHDKNNSVKTLCRFMIVQIGVYAVGVQHKPLEQVPGAAFADISKDIAFEVEKRQRHIDYCKNNLNFIICGHVHTAWRFKKIFGVTHFNVGVDVNRYMPLCDAEIVREYEAFSKTGKEIV